MSPLRRRLIEDMQIRNLAPSTQRAYVAQLVHFAYYFRKSPDLLGPAEIRAYLIYLAQEKRLAASSIIVTVSALRFFYTGDSQATLGYRSRHPHRASGEEASRRAEPGRGCPLSRRRGQFETSHGADCLLRDRPADFGSGSPHPGGDRQQAHGHPGRTRQGRQRPLCDVIPETSRYAQELLGQDPSRGMALSRSMARRTDRSIQHRCHLPGGQTTVRHRQTGHAAFAAPRLRRSPSRGRHQPNVPSSCCSVIAISPPRPGIS